MTDAVVVLVNCANASEAARIARALVTERLAACVNVQQSAVRSIYRWQGKLERTREVMLIIKTTRRLFAPLESRVRKLHGYAVPEIIALPVAAGSRRYLAWMERSVGGRRGRRRR
ncbi:MAG TPA: divalent-cation tolerance protein CutA [Candidatus Acidoferrales bacterium]|nr:divalent-cation tolerance protein CutA [Candidatus Acidoferrales bacterium]